MTNTHLTRKALHWMLIRRLSTAGLIIALLIGVSVLINERRRTSEAVLEYAVQGTLNFNISAADLLEGGAPFDRMKMKHALDEFILQRVKIRRGSNNGYVVLVKLRDTNGDLLAEIHDKGYKHIEAVLAYSAQHRLSLFNGEKGVYKAVRINDEPHVDVDVPLTNRKGKTVAYAKVVYAVSDQAIASARKRAVRSMLYVIGIVFITTVLLYPIIFALLKRLTVLTSDLLDSHMETLKVLGSAIAKRDSDTDIHNYRVTIISTRTAEALGLDDDTIRTLIKGAFLHDLGKIGISDNILLKPGKLTEDEYKVMKTHVDAGIDIIKRSVWLKDATSVVFGHHEKVDGSGYPKGLMGNDNPITARIFAIADVFDALTSRRPYKAPLSFEEAMDILEKDRGTHFDPDFLDAFSKIARSLHDNFAAHSDGEIKKNLEAIIEHYFSM